MHFVASYKKRWLCEAIDALTHSCICAYAMLQHNKGLPTVKGSLRSPTSSASPLTAGPAPLVTPCNRQANPMDCLALRMA